MGLRSDTDASHRDPPLSAIALLLMLSFLAAASLFGGADFIAIVLPGGLPLGNVLAALFFCGLSGAALLIAPRGAWARRIAAAATAASVAWLPLSIALAGNAQLNFSGQRGLVWAWFTAGLLVVALCALLLAAAASYWARRKQV